MAHRAAYMFATGPIPDGLVIDHLCRNKGCVNPSHLEPVSQATNILRGVDPAVTRRRHAAKTICKNGHAFTPENTKLRKNGKCASRACRQCSRDRARKHRAANLEQARKYDREWKMARRAKLGSLRTPS
jgi:hypothetical protein